MVLPTVGYAALDVVSLALPMVHKRRYKVNNIIVVAYPDFISM